MKKIAVLVLLFATIAAQACAHSQIPSPLDLTIYQTCPQPITFTARIGQIVGIPVGVVVGAVGGIVAIPFNDFDVIESVAGGALIGAYAGGMGGSAITGAPAYGVYRLFNWAGCPN